LATDHFNQRHAGGAGAIQQQEEPVDRQPPGRIDQFLRGALFAVVAHGTDKADQGGVVGQQNPALEIDAAVALVIEAAARGRIWDRAPDG
jgi:hypothetical protein